MTQGEREVFIDIEPGVRIRYRRSEPPPPVSYAITLEIYQDGKWATVRLWDNADDVAEHHEHEYTRDTGKQSPTLLDVDSVNDAMAAAIRKAKAISGEIVRKWKDES